jgi:fumarylacetoacetase
MYAPSRRLDIELELGFVVGVPSTPGEPVTPERFAEHVFGVVLVNDWSARDIQAWEYVPLGPFLGKSFLPSISAWVTPLALLEEHRVELPSGSAAAAHLSGVATGPSTFRSRSS